MIPKSALAALCLLVASAAVVGQNLPVERIIRIDVPSHDAVYSLTRQLRLAVIDAQPSYITAYADDAQIAHIRGLGYKVTVLVDDYRKQAELDLVNYYSYAQVCSIMNAVTADYPGIAKLETLGLSAGSRPIPAMKVTLDPQIENGRPRIRLIGAHHGNEKISTEVTLSFLQYLCDNYAADPQIRYLVDNREFWVIPVFNPDGHAANSRGNANGTDLNRDYGYEWGDETGNGAAFSEPETRAMHRHSELHQPVLEYAYHSRAAYVNYPWDNTPVDPPDSDYVIALSQRYADSTYGSGTTELEPINGYDWYEVHGSCQDHTFGAFGALAWTIETDLPNQRVKIDSICVANRRALLEMSTRAGWGIAGRVYDSVTLEPLFARVEFTSPRRWNTYTQPGSGDFHKMVGAGTYAVRVTSNGYTPKTVNDVVVADTGAVALDLALARAEPDPLNYCQRIVIVKRYDYSHVYTGVAPDALGAPDSGYYRLGSGDSYVIFDLDPNVPARNRTGDDIAVHATGAYTLAAANDWQGPWQSLGNGSGRQSFDLAGTGLDSARYLRIADAGSCQLDGIAFVGSPPTGTSEAGGMPFGPRVRVSPSPATTSVTLDLGLGLDSGPASVRILDASGRVAAESQITNHKSQMRLDLRGLRAGVYFCRVEQAGRASSAKLVVRH